MTAPDDPLSASLERVRHRAAQAAGRAAAATALMPSSCEGTDPARAVAVTLDGAGLPTAVRVAPDWSRRIAPGAFGTAVTSACRAAQMSRLADWGDRMARTRPASVPLPPPAPVGSPATLADLRRRVRDAGPLPGHPAPDDGFTGRDAGGRLTVTIGAEGVRDCTADTRWIAAQSGGRLATAVLAAVGQARDARAAAPPDARAEELRGIADDAVALLRHLATGAAPGRASR